MVDNPPKDQPRIAPYLLYEDVAAAMEWLAATFGFEERLRMPGPDGAVMHGEIALGDAVVMMGCPGPDYRNPGRDGRVTHIVHAYVEDVDAHCEHARTAGAEIITEPTDQSYGDRNYRTRDPQGHEWTFSQRVRDVDLGAG